VLTLWKMLTPIGVASSLCLRNGIATLEVRHQINSLAMGIKKFPTAVAGHWSIETTRSRVLNMMHQEVASRIRDKMLNAKVARINRFNPVTPRPASRPGESDHDASQLP
jgi:hypothetical protein